MKVPGIWKGFGCFLIVVPLMGLFNLLKLSVKFGFDDIYAILGIFMWFSLLSVLFSISVGVLLIRGSIWGYHLSKVLLAITVINGIFLMFDFDPATFYPLLLRFILLYKLIYSKTTNLYLSELRYNANKIML
ncbi:hypothetical protein [Enterococcus sp. AZ126]|uniref:hypothetical protein n=1 Tax=Enterococcus sp. AZ126 TaxID=2774635 RepID=UPI003F2556F8